MLKIFHKIEICFKIMLIIFINCCIFQLITLINFVFVKYYYTFVLLDGANMKHLYKVVEELNLLYVKIDPEFTEHNFSNLKKRAEANKGYIDKFKINKFIVDYSLIGLDVDKETLFNMTRNMRQFLSFPDNIKIVIYEGEIYSKSKWVRYNTYLDSFGVDYIKGFDKMEKVFKWFGLNIDDIKLLEDKEFIN